MENDPTPPKPPKERSLATIIFFVALMMTLGGLLIYASFGSRYQYELPDDEPSSAN